MTVMFYVNYISTVIEILSAALLATEIVFIPLACSRTRKYSFFKCFIFHECFGLLSWAVSFQLIRGIGCSSRSYLSLNVLLSGFSLHGYLLSSMLLSLNRFSCIAFPLGFSSKWTNTRCTMYMAIIVCITALSVCYRIGAPIEALWIEELQSWRWTGYPHTIHVVSLAVTLSICAFVTVGSLILNTWTFVGWKKYRNNVSTCIYRTQRKMFIFSVITFVLCLCICLEQLIANAVMFTGNMELATTLFGLYAPLSSIAILIDPYSIIILSPGLRKEVLALVNRTTGHGVMEMAAVSHHSPNRVKTLEHNNTHVNGGCSDKFSHDMVQHQLRQIRS